MAANGDAGAAVRALSTRFYARKVVHDLLWAVTSPHLIDAAVFPVLPVGFGLHNGDAPTTRLGEWLDALEADPAHLMAFLQEQTNSSAKALALGVYFASLLEYWLRFCPLLRVAHFERGKQIISSSNQTLGQLKFLFRVLHDDADTYEDFHVESSVKFFLLHPLNEQLRSLGDTTSHHATTYPLEQFVGPHLGENLAWRVQEVARKLDLCRGESVQQWLRERYSDRVASRIVLRGYLFYPLHHFESTSHVSRDHDWQYHRNPTSGPPETSRHNPQIGADHLRGWWASDLEREFASRVRANDAAHVGESRFVVLPKLHWLTPVLAEEINGRVVIQGDEQLHIDTVVSMSLEELLTFARSHFATLVSSREAKAKGGVVMPLLVAEIVLCRPSDLEFDGTGARWKELSRGFLLDPKSWDPLPLCHEPVRFKRTNEDLSHREREYEGRREWGHDDGVVKPTEQEAELARQRKLHAFPDVAVVTPVTMCEELLTILARDQKLFTHSNLKHSVQSVLLHRVGTTPLDSASLFLLESLQFLVRGDLEKERLTDDSKLVQRVAHLLLDAFEGRPTTSVQDATLLQFVGLFEAVARDESLWNYINLSLRAIDIHMRGLSSQLEENGVFHVTVKRLLEKNIPRWNAVAVEIARVVYADAKSDYVAALRHDMLTTLMDQHDWKHAEQFATSCCHSDVQLLFVLFRRFQTLHMTKPMKRLRKALSRLSTRSSLQQLDSNGHLPPHIRSLGPPIDVEANYATVIGQLPPLCWTLADTTDHIDEILTQLHDVVASRQQQPMIMGLDCEWRPQFLFKETSAAIGGDSLQVAEVDEGVSVYQIAFGDHVYVVDVQVLGAAAVAPLEFVWNAPPGVFLLAGFCVAEDLRRLHQSFPSLLLAEDSSPRKMLIELKQMALYRQLPATTWGLSQLYDACFKEQVDKEEQCSDWGLRPLREQQIEYAARDAYAVRNIALHLLADVATEEEDLMQYAEKFVVAAHSRETETVLDQWLTPLAPLNESHVRAALVELRLHTVAQSLFAVPKADWSKQPRLPEGLVVKTVAVVLRRGGRTSHGRESNVVHYAAVVLHVALSIDMEALAAHFSVPVDDLQLADPETLLRVFGYPRGAIGPIGLRDQRAVGIVLDAALLIEAALLPGAGHEELTYAIAPRVLIETVGASVATLTHEVHI